MDEQKGMTPEELEAQANAILAAADMEIMDTLEPMDPQPVRKKSKKNKKFVVILPRFASVKKNEKHNAKN